ncbi:MAG: hypothetical protein NTNFB01_05610 [Nitrospira sp.]
MKPSRATISDVPLGVVTSLQGKSPVFVPLGFLVSWDTVLEKESAMPDIRLVILIM